MDLMWKVGGIMAIAICIIICVTVIIIGVLCTWCHYMDYTHDLSLSAEMELRQNVRGMFVNVEYLNERIEHIEELLGQ